MKGLTYLYKTLLLVGSVLLALALHTACANRGQGPQGGPKDTLPPLVIGCTPANGSVGVSTRTFEIEFDELVQVDNVMQNVVISPPQKVMPTIKASGRKVRIVFDDSLAANTTYSFVFNKAIVDNNERNPLEHFAYVFSTGQKIDSLQISGLVLDAQTLAPMAGLIVGVHSDHADSAFLTKPFDRIARTDKDGSFTVQNMAPGSYRLYALKDLTNSFMYIPAGADIAFMDSLVTPELHLHAKVDTIWKTPQKLAYDTIIVNTFPESYPKDLLLKTFIEETPCRQLMDRPKRLSDKHFQLTFGCPIDSMPRISLVDDTLGRTDWYHMEPMMRPDSLVYWITDSLVYQRDTVRLAIDYYEADSLFQLVPVRDTVALVVANKPTTRRNRRKEQEIAQPKLLPLTYTHNLNGALEVYDTVQLVFEQPIQSFVKDSIHLYYLQDTVEVPMPFQVAFNDSVCATKFYIGFVKDFDKKYQLRIDSAAFISLYGQVNHHFNKPFHFKKLEEYSNLYVQFPVVPEHAVVELLDMREQVIARSPIIDGEAYFEDLKPGKVALRLYIDQNNNNQWDTGVLLQHQQPEPVYYYPKTITLRANWDVEETWSVFVAPWEKQRPTDLKSNKK